jgi:hypothetical protein
MRTSYSVAIGCVSAWALVVACGGKIDETNTGTDPSGTANGSASDDPSGSGGGSAPGAPGSLPPSSPTGGPGSPPPPPPPGTSSGGSSGTTPAPGIACGKTSCNSSTQECCLSLAGGGPGSVSSACTAKGSCASGVALSCSSAASCAAGQVCCLGQSNSGASAECKTSCGGGGGPGGPGGNFSVQLCNADPECPKNQECEPLQFGLKACRPKF